jgi:cysteinyl-tRNA synthetase
VTRTRIPDGVLSAAHARSAARAARDWPEADRLRAEIEAAGWRVVDRGTDFALTPAGAPDIVEGDRVRYGASRNVPSLLDVPATGLATVVLLATDRPAELARALAGLRAHLPGATSIVIVADDPSDDQAAALDGPIDARTEIVWTSDRLGRAAALNAGVRRSTGPVVVILGSDVEPVGDIVTPLARALDDPAVGIAGPWGAVTRDLRSFDEATSGDVDVVDGAVQAFRREDVASRGPLEERFHAQAYLDAWWSLVLRDQGEGNPPRRAVALPDLPLVRHRAPVAEPTPDSARRAKRDFYRVIERFGDRLDLRSGPA